jgi:hypothetical protein
MSAEAILSLGCFIIACCLAGILYMNWRAESHITRLIRQMNEEAIRATELAEHQGEPS